MRDLIAKGLPGGFDACDAALYADEPKLMHKYTRGDGGVVYEYYARENAQSETVCGARCLGLGVEGPHLGTLRGRGLALAR